MTESPKPSQPASSPKKIGNLDVFKHMADTGDNELKLAPMQNVIAVNYNHKRGTEVTFGVEGSVWQKIENNELVGGFIFCDRQHFNAVKKSLECAPGDRQ